MRIISSTAPLPVWRSILFVPAVNDRFVESALKQAADVLQIDLEDSVGPTQKEMARQRTGALADRFAAAGRDVTVRVNRPWRLLVRDLEAVVRPSVLAVALPKVPDAAFVLSVCEVLDELEHERGMKNGHTRIIAMVEDPQGLSAMNEIAAAHSRVVGLIVAQKIWQLRFKWPSPKTGSMFPMFWRSQRQGVQAFFQWDSLALWLITRMQMLFAPKFRERVAWALRALFVFIPARLPS